MKRLYTLLFVLITGAGAFAQPYDNAWINYSQSYYKVKVWQDGLYRVPVNTFLAAGVPITSWDCRNLQVFHNGVEQYVYIFDQNGNNHIDGSDYLEFYGQHNDGSLDTRMYADPNWQPNMNYSLYTDTSVYFITFNNSLLNRRVTVVPDTNYSAYAASDYFIKESYREETNTYNEGTTTSYGGTDIDYTEAEGWMDSYFQAGAPAVKTLNTQNIFTGGPNIEINTAVAGANSNAHNISIVFPGANFSDSYSGYTMKRYSFSISPAVFSSASTNFTYNAFNSVDHNAFVWLSVKYPHTFDLENASVFKMFVPDNNIQSKARLDITNFNMSGASAALLYDITNHKRFTVIQTGSTLHALVDNDGQSTAKTCFLAADNQVITVSPANISSFLYINQNPGIFNNFLSSPVDSAYLIITNRLLWNEAIQYKQYRDITTHNKTLLVDIDELYDQFAWGIKKHPLAIRNFVKYILDHWTTVHPPQALFLLGKSISEQGSRQNPANFAACLIPSYGNPPSDILFSSGINGSLYDPKIPTGRLSATQPVQVSDYLQKVQDYETTQAGAPQPWMKEVLHFSGGANPGEQDMIRTFMDRFKDIVEDTMYGGHVTTYQKTSSSPIVFNTSDELRNRINAGVSLMTFYGHASGTGFDQSTDIPENYSNAGKYPFILANSCFAGDIHTSSPSISERFVTVRNAGAIAFIASVGLGDAGFLFVYSDSLYKNFSYKYYGETIGKQMQQNILQVQDSTVPGKKTVCQEMTLEGDPNIHMNSWKKPDLMISQPNIFFTPASVTTDLDTFNVHVIVRNIAKAVPDSFNVILHRTFPNGSDSVLTRRIGHCYYADTLLFNMRVNPGFNAAGINTFTVHVDLEDSVHEIDDVMNNTASTTLYITSRDLIPVYPPKFAIVPSGTTALKASTVNPLAGMKTYRFEMDTSYQAFGNPPQPSPMFRFTTITDSGGVITWNNNVTLGDSVVYYWRVANDSVQNDPVRYKWQESSFIHIPAKTGWSQKHFYQYKDNTYRNVLPDSTARRFNFVLNQRTVNVLDWGNPFAPVDHANDVGYGMDGSVQDYGGCGVASAVMIAVIDSITLEPWLTSCYNFGQANPFTIITGACDDPNMHGTTSCNSRNRPEKYFIFRYSDAAQMTALGNMMSQIPAGDYILAYSWVTFPYSTVPAFASAMNTAGFQTAYFQDNNPFIFFVQKGGSISQHVTGITTNDSIAFNIPLTTRWNRGTITTDLIGPATRWTELHWARHALETGHTRDSVALSIYGFNSSTNRLDTLRSAMQPSSFDTTLSWISAVQYPYLMMQLFLSDDSLRTSPQLDKWQIYYDEAPECALNANRHFSFHANPIAEGDTVRMSVAIDNIGSKPMDSLAVDFYLYDQNRVRHNIKSVKLDSLRVGQSLTANVEIDSTYGLAGTNSLWIEANPFGSRHQNEQVHFNNLAEMKFTMNRDVINPILDVTFDGIHILDDDIVSGKPNITIQLHDENKFLALNDTADFRVYLKTPSGNTEDRIYFSHPAYGGNMRFTPAILPKNSCRIDWTPVFTEDGTYVLDVEAADRSKNESGKFNYRISFEVINKSTITEVLNYPNPFSTSTRFVYVLTGNQIPEYMKIQIMTVTGKIIREITQSELGNIHIGRNISDYAWDGKDEYGDQLANGVYLYRVITNISGSQVEHRDTEADKYFKKGWGKMYLLR